MTALVTNRRLPDTKSRRFRFYDLFLVNIEYADYVLIFRQGKPGLKEFEETAYAVQDVDEGEHAPCAPYAEFLIAKLDPAPDDKDAHEVYRCVVPIDRGTPGSCTCTGQNTKRVCKHLDALTDACHVAETEPPDIG